MIDIHTHILPHIDDGAQSTAIAKELLLEQQRQGVTSIVLTPHFYGKTYSPQRFLRKRDETFACIKELIPDGVELRLGAEIHFTGVNVPEYADLCSLAIEGTRYLLVELPFTEKWTSDIMDIIGDFAYETGYTPIIAHVERYREIKKKPHLVNDFVDMGCLIQVNADSFLDKKDKGLAFALLRHGLVHCIGSDTHDLETRTPCLLQAKQAIEAAGYAEEWEKIQQNMKNILADEIVETEYVLPVKKFLGRYR